MGAVPPTAKTDITPQLLFARHNFDNHQSLIRLADTKAAVYITLIIFLGASSFPIAKDVIGNLRWHWGGGEFTSGLYLLSYAVFFLSFLRIISLAYEIIKPRGARHYRSSKPGLLLMFYEHVLLHASNQAYFDAVANAPADLILRNTTDQVFELAHICREKMAALSRARTPLLVAFAAWLCNVCVGLWMVTWK